MTDHAANGHAARLTIAITISLVVLLVACGLRLSIGSSDFGVPDSEHWWLILQTRWHRLSLALVCGAALATAGVALQALLRNPLAEPFILGLSSGAAAGVMAQSVLYYELNLALGGHHVGAAIGAAASMLIVFACARRGGMIDPLGLLLTGVVLATINGAIIMFLNYQVGPGGIRDDVAQWMMGQLNENASVWTVRGTTALTAAGIVVLWFKGRAMDVATLSDAEATSVGVNLSALRTVLFVTSSLLAAGAVVIAGPIAFVGLICPHLARLMVGPSHRGLIVISAILGAALIVLADAVSAAVALWYDTGVMPIGIFTAIVGGPVFLWMLRPQLGRA